MEDPQRDGAGKPQEMGNNTPLPLDLCVCVCVRVCVCVCERERERDTEGVVVVLKEHSVWIKVTLFVSLFVSASAITNVLRLLAFFPVPF